MGRYWTSGNTIGKLYPGWLIIPSGKQQRMSLYTDEWVPHLLRALPDMELLDQLSAIFECVWRKSLLMEPPGPELVKVASSVLKMIDCQGRTVKDFQESQEGLGKNTDRVGQRGDDASHGRSS